MASLGFFRTSIHSMTDVARDNPYLGTVSNAFKRPMNRWGFVGADCKSQQIFNLDLPSEDVLCMVIPQVDLRCAANGNTSGLAVI